jgi:hypothetical protein
MYNLAPLISLFSCTVPIPQASWDLILKFIFYVLVPQYQEKTLKFTRKET